MRIADAIELVRPRQWTKNLAVFAALVFAGRLGDPSDIAVSVGAFVALDLITAGLYALNDVIDVERDRQHPVKQGRPVASGRVTPASALIIGGMALMAGLALSAMLGTGFLLAMLGFVAIHVLYTFALKHVAIVDMLVIALGFVLRAVAGALVLEVPVSPWLVLCTGLLALFLAAAKRRHELLLLRDHSKDHRPVLSQYSAELLDSFMVTLSAATITSYALYTFFEEGAPGYSLMFTIPFVIYGVLRYQALVLLRGRGGRPSEILLDDKPILIAVTLWVITAAVALYALPGMWG